MAGLLAVFALSLPLWAEPGEDHWSPPADPAASAKLMEARAFIVDRQYDKARTRLLDLAKSQPANADVFNLLGYVARHLNDLNASAAHYARALHLKPDHLGALEYQGELFLRQGDLAAAESNLSKLASLCPADCHERSELERAISAWKAGQSYSAEKY